jgi:hypothetical protein
MPLWTSTDGGKTWRQAQVTAGRDGDGERRFDVTAVYPKAGEGSVSLKASGVVFCSGLGSRSRQQGEPGERRYQIRCCPGPPATPNGRR